MIRLKNLSKKFAKTPVLDNINLNIAEGDRIALIGQNGSGKTTLIRIILGQYLYDGDLSVMGKNPRQHRVEVLDRIGFVPQLPPPIQISVEELVELSANISSRSSKSKIFETAENLGLDISAHRKKQFQRLSGGMKQKLLIAIALAKKPDILIMDEPAANLDPQGRQAFFLQLLRSMENTTMLLSSHRIDEIINLINRIVEIDHGSIIQDEKIAATKMADQMLNCEIAFVSSNEKLEQLLVDWNFSSTKNQLFFEGQFIGAERLRFFTILSHYANYIESINIQ